MQLSSSREWDTLHYAGGNSETKGRFTSDEDNTSKILSSISLSCTHKNTKTKISFNCILTIRCFTCYLPPTWSTQHFWLNCIHHLKLAYFILWLNAISVWYLLTTTTTTTTTTTINFAGTTFRNQSASHLGIQIKKNMRQILSSKFCSKTLRLPDYLPVNNNVISQNSL